MSRGGSYKPCLLARHIRRASRQGLGSVRQRAYSTTLGNHSEIAGMYVTAISTMNSTT